MFLSRAEELVGGVLGISGNMVGVLAQLMATGTF